MKQGSRKIYLGGGGLDPPPRPPAPLEGSPRAGSLFSIFFLHVSNHWVLISHHIAKLPCHLLEPLVNCPMLLAKLVMQAQTSAHPVTMPVPICHAGGEQTAAL